MAIPLHFYPSVGNPLCWFTAAARVGAVLDPPDLEGFTRHAVELARRGAAGLDRERFDAEVDGIGAAIDMETDRDWVALSVTCLERNLERAVELAAAILRDPLMDAHEHELLRRETIAELDDVRDDDGSLVDRYYLRHCAPGHSYGRTTLGTERSLPRLELDAVKQHHGALWAPDHLVFGVAGPITPARGGEVAAALTAAAGGGRVAAPRPALEAPPLPPGRRVFVIDKPQRTQCQMMIGHLAPRYGTDDFAALLPFETAFGGLFSSRLMQEVRVARGWSYGASCRMQRARAPHWFRIQLAPTREVTVQALQLVIELYEKAAADGLTPDELELATKHMTGALPFVQATARQRMRLAVRHDLLDLQPDYPARLGDQLARITLDDVRAAASRWLDPANLCIVLVATADDIVPDLERAGFPPTAVLPYDSY
ncbi:MAG TPA: pitrilysin family protein [Kofleriaceae bacterium]|nr:pitrilysin family protein [Kofleriaceae bacterium]